MQVIDVQRAEKNKIGRDSGHPVRVSTRLVEYLQVGEYYSETSDNSSRAGVARGRKYGGIERGGESRCRQPDCRNVAEDC